MSQEVRVIFPEDLEAGATEVGDDGEERLVQEFPIPDGAIPVRMQTGDLPVTIIGWISEGSGLPGLLRSVADETERIMNSRAEASGSGEEGEASDSSR